MEELNGYTPPASLNLSDFQDAIGDAVVQAIIKIGIRVKSSAVGTASTGRETKTLCVCCIPSLTQMPEATRARLFAWK